MLYKLLCYQIPICTILFGILYIEPNIMIKYNNSAIPYTTIGIFIMNSLVECLQHLPYFDRTKTLEYGSGINMDELTWKESYKLISVHFIHKDGFLYHYIPNMIITVIFGSFIERTIGYYAFLNMNLLLIFLYWILVNVFIKRTREGAGFSSIYYSFLLVL